MTRNIERMLHRYCPLGFPLSRQAGEALEFRSLLEPSTGDSSFPGPHAIRQVADRFNQSPVREAQGAAPLQPGQLISVGIIVDVLRYVAIAYCHEQVPGVVDKGIQWVEEKRGRTTAQKPPPAFALLFPPKIVVAGQQPEAEFRRRMEKTPDLREMTIQEIILLFFSMANPAFRPFRPLFDDHELKQQAPYITLVNGLAEFFSHQPVFAPLGMTLFECLRAPIEAAPDSLEGQLDYIRRHWAAFLPAELLEQVLLAADILKEEILLRGLGPGPSRVIDFVRDEYGFDAGYAEPAAFSPDADWMSNVVLLAKSAYVWLDQLSKKYSRPIRSLGDVPDEELDLLRRWGFTGLWLIGVWERSPASKTIKQMMGNPEAESSAYSLFDYDIAADLGGEAAYQDLRERAWRRGIRLASDMVPNHMGVYSRWVIEHPGWFMQLPYAPFPVYRFTGNDLSHDERVCIQIEDGYWTHRDAAVVFKRLDKWSGEAVYVYHGNDGTSMPWNDTAQLNFLLPEVREAVIQTILHVARKFSIIRFDAAMTLAKRHFQRLWFPKPGDGGAIPSRAEHGMSKTAFDAAFPKEFWREVVDRVAAEVPDTLLIAEAFWLMEGYFVRTLGMHRVYNSAFMNMLKMEDNAKYRTTVKNVLEFSPEVIKRFVNFMNNPDERTAVEQFGRGDKYFGAAMMLVTMPGLPMFGHGQIEGFTEKYGMEYRRAYWDEPVDEEMVRRHEREIFPLMRRRRLFSGAADFAFYDFVTDGGWVDENVFAYSNRAGDERAVILYNNAFNTTSGRIHTSTPINVGIGDETCYVRRTLAEALGLNTGDGHLYAFRDHRTGLEYVRSGRHLAEEGMFAQLHAYQYHAFLDFREISDGDGSWRHLMDRLAGGGVPSLQLARREMLLEPVRGPFREAVNGAMMRALLAGEAGSGDMFRQKVRVLVESARHFSGSTVDGEAIIADINGETEAVLHAAVESATPETDASVVDGIRPMMMVGAIMHHLGRLAGGEDDRVIRQAGREYVEQWLLHSLIVAMFRELEENDADADRDAGLVSILLSFDNLLMCESTSDLAVEAAALVADAAARQFLQVNRYDNVDWLSKERLERLLEAMLASLAIRQQSDSAISEAMLSTAAERRALIGEAASRAGYQVDRMIELLTGESPTDS